ncbi:type IV pilin [Haloplanus litoreus]|uniref:Type IV pilin n=1 Tax=Haloplanus litoreus TaxID=767515 RepID=A0ABD5ZX44_9EURY
MPDRAQSDAVGAVLLVGLVTVSVGVVGAYAVGAMTDGTDTPRVDVTGEVRTDGITLSNQGGGSLPSESLRLSVRVNGSETPLSWGDGTLSGGAESFDPGEIWSVARSDDPDSVVTVRLIHRPSNTVLFRVERSPTSGESVNADTGGYIEAVDSEGEVAGESESTLEPSPSTPESTPTTEPPTDECDEDGEDCEDEGEDENDDDGPPWDDDNDGPPWDDD